MKGKKYKSLMKKIKNCMSALQEKCPNDFLKCDCNKGNYETYENIRKMNIGGYIFVGWRELSNGKDDYYQLIVADTSDVGYAAGYIDLGEYVTCAVVYSGYVDWSGRGDHCLVLKLGNNILPKSLTERLLKNIDWGEEPESDVDWSKINETNENIIEEDLENILKFIEMYSLKKDLEKDLGPLF